MAKVNNLSESFLNGLNEIEFVLSSLLFTKKSIIRKGHAFFVSYYKDETIVEFLFGPSDWEIEMTIITSKRKYAFKDLLQIQEIFKWVNENRYIQVSKRDIGKELSWFVDLLGISLPKIE